MTRVLVIAIIIVLAGGGFAAVLLWPQSQPEHDPVNKVSPQGVLRDDFDGANTLAWDIIRPQKGSVSLTSHPGELSIRTEVGSIWQQQPEADRAKNLYVIPNPAAADDSWQMTTQLVEFMPKGQFHQAGLLIYQDDDNYIKFVVQYNSQTVRKLGFSFERKGVATAHRFDLDPAQKNIWLRISHRQGHYDAFISYNGQDFQALDSIPWDGQPEQLGLISKQGGNAALPTIEARFGFFEFQELPEETGQNDTEQASK